MKFNLPRQEIANYLAKFSFTKIKSEKISVPKAPLKRLLEIKKVAQEIEKEGIPRRFVLKKLEGKLGHGIFLHPNAQPIQRGEVIGPYSGKVNLAPQEYGDGSDYIFSLLSDLHLTKAEQKLFDPKNKFHPRRLYSLDLDADKRGNFTRYINHSAKPNVEAHLWSLEASPCEIIYVAKKTIHPGEQLLVCYDGEDKSYWGRLKIKPVPITPQTFLLLPTLKLHRSQP